MSSQYKNLSSTLFEAGEKIKHTIQTLKEDIQKNSNWRKNMNTIVWITWHRFYMPNKHYQLIRKLCNVGNKRRRVAF